jgi:hypothetical protein
MDFDCPNCKVDLKEKSPSRKYFKVESGVQVSGYYYQCPSCKSLLTKHEHSIERNVKFAPLYMLIPLNLATFLLDVFGYSNLIRSHFNIFTITMLLAGFLFYIPRVKKYCMRQVPNDWTRWILYARAKSE